MGNVQSIAPAVAPIVKGGAGVQWRVTVIIPVYNDIGGLGLCLAALSDQTYPRDRVEIIVVDNGSDVDVGAVVSEYPGVELVHEKQAGSYVARNKGISIAKNNVFAFIDSDCVAATDWLGCGIRRLVETPGVGVVGGRMKFSYMDSVAPNIWEAYDSIAHLDQKAYIETCGFSATGNMFTTRAIFETVGLFNPEMRSGGDREWGQRVGRRGFSLVYADDVVVLHPARKTFKALFDKACRTSGGSHYISSSNQKEAGYAGFLRDLLPPMKRIRSVFGDKRWNMSRRVQLAVLLVLFKYIRTIEKVRIIRGGNARR